MSIPERQVLLEHVGFLRAIALGVLRNEADADDAVQQTLATALQKPPADDANLRGWLASVVRNFARMQLRSRGRRRAREEVVARREDSAPSAAHIAQRMEMERHVVDAVATLEEPFRTTLILRFYDDLQPKEIAARLGVPDATVRTRLKRGLDKLRGKLDGKSGGNRKATYAGLLLLAQLPARATPLRWIPVAGIAAVLVGVVSIVALVEVNREDARDSTERASVADRPLDANGNDAAIAERTAPPDSAACSVAGRVIDRSGAGESGVDVIAYEHAGASLLDTPMNRWRRWTEPPAELARTRSGAMGNYDLRIRPARPFWLVFRKVGRAARVLPVSEGTGSYVGVDVTLQRADGVEGTLVGDDGQPIAGAVIHAWTPEYTMFGAPALVTVETGQRGEYVLPFATTYFDGRFDDLNRLSLVVDARAAGYAPRVFRRLLAPYTLPPLRRGGAITIRTAPGAGLVMFGPEAIDRARAGDDGVATFPEFPDGDRILVLLHDDYAPKQVPIAASDVIPPGIALSPGLVLRGRLCNEMGTRPLVAAAIGVAPREVGDGMLFDALHATHTDAGGAFELRDAPGGEHTLVVAHPATAPRPLLPWKDALPLPVPGSDLFRGRVVDEVGAPVAGARVRIRRRGFYDRWVREQRRLWTAITRADGSFVMRGIPRSGAWMEHTSVEVRHPVHGAGRFAGVPTDGPVRLSVSAFPRVEVPPAEDSRATPLPLPDVEVAMLRGVVHGITDEPRPGVAVRDVAHGEEPVRTDERGRFTIRLEGPFPHTLRLADGTLTHEIRVERETAWLQLRFPDAQRLSGHVTHAGEPVVGAHVRVVCDGSAVERARTGADGRFTVQRWPRYGPRELVIEQPGYLTVRLEDPPEADIELTRAAPLTVRVEDEQGMPRNNVELLLGERRVVSDIDGLVRLYRTSASPPGFTVVPGGPGWIRIGEPRWSGDRQAVTLVVRRGERIEGRVVDSENRGVPHIPIHAQPTVPGRAIRRAFTNSQGYFTLRALHPERYELRVGGADRGVEIEAGATELVLREEAR